MSRYCKIRCSVCNAEIGSMMIPEGNIQIISGEMVVKGGLTSDVDLIVHDCSEEHKCEDCGWLSNSYSEGEEDGFQTGKQEGYLNGLYRMVNILEETLKHKGRKLFSKYAWIFNPLKKDYDKVRNDYFENDIPDLACRSCSDFDVGVQEGRILGIAEGHVLGHDKAVVFLMAVLIEMLQEGDVLSIKKVIDTLGEEGAFQEKEYNSIITKMKTITALTEIHRYHSREVKVLCNAPFTEFDKNHPDYPEVPNLQSVLINLSPELLEDKK